MPKVSTAPFVQDHNILSATLTAQCVIGTAGTPTNTALLATANAQGSLLTALSAMPRASVTAANGIYLFLSKNGGTTKSLLDSELMAAYTLSATTKVPKTKFIDYTEDTPLRLGAGESLYVGLATALAAGVDVHAQVSNFELKA